MRTIFAIFTSLLLVNMALGQGIEVTVKSYGVTNSVSAKTDTNSVEKVATNAPAITVGGQASVATSFAPSAPNAFVAPAQPQPIIEYVAQPPAPDRCVERQGDRVPYPGWSYRRSEYRSGWGGGGGNYGAQGYSPDSMGDVSSGSSYRGQGVGSGFQVISQGYSTSSMLKVPSYRGQVSSGGGSQGYSPASMR